MILGCDKPEQTAIANEICKELSEIMGAKEDRMYAAGNSYGIFTYVAAKLLASAIHNFGYGEEREPHLDAFSELTRVILSRMEAN